MNEQIKKWKDQYKEVYQLSLDGVKYIFRVLNVGEITKFHYFVNSGDNDAAEDVVLKSILFPYDFDPENVTMSVARKLIDSIVGKSKVTNIDGVKEIIDSSRKLVENDLENDFVQWKLLVLKTFTGYKMSDLDVMHPSDFFYLLCLVERLAGVPILNEDQAATPNVNPGSDSNSGSPDDLVTTTDKFLSQSDLEQISIDNSTAALQEHMRKYKR